MKRGRGGKNRGQGGWIGDGKKKRKSGEERESGEGMEKGSWEGRERRSGEGMERRGSWEETER